jgi:alkanesulfonate monooxygenase SsuD/methylene tetrahydromethanopterin reductase-like flavin-dependent oxidoreductase (luciferase family)
MGGTYQQLLAAARMAEESGLATFARSDHYYHDLQPRPEATDAFATMAGLARETSHIRLCILVAPITFRHPAVLAKSAATIDQMSNGRFDFGVGTGWMDLEHDAFGIPFPPMKERFQRLEESLLYIRAAFNGTPYQGTHYRIDAEARPRPQGIGLIVGGSGKQRTPQLAGRLADEYNHFFRDPDEIGAKVTLAKRAAEKAGRDPDELTVSLMGPIVIGQNQADYEEMLHLEAARRGLDAAGLEASFKEKAVPSGPVSVVAEQLASLEKIGVSKVYVQWLDLSDLEGLTANVALVKQALPS